MLSNSTSYTYSVNKDIRYEIGDEVNIYTFYRYSNGTVTSESALYRTLDSYGLVTSSLLLVGALLLSIF